MPVAFLQKLTPLSKLHCRSIRVISDITITTLSRIAMARMGKRIPLALIGIKMLHGMLQAAVSGVTKKAFFQKEDH